MHAVLGTLYVIGSLQEYADFGIRQAQLSVDVAARQDFRAPRWPLALRPESNRCIKVVNVNGEIRDSATMHCPSSFVSSLIHRR